MRVLLVLAVSIGLAACQVAGSGSPLPYTDDFEGECRWPARDDERVTAGCVQSAYQIVVRKQDRGDLMFLNFEDGVESLRFEADVGLASEHQNHIGHYVSYGLGCWTGVSQSETDLPETPGYVAFATSDGGFELGRWEGDRETERLVYRDSSALVLRPGSNHLALDCARRDDATRLVFSVNDKVVAVAEDEQSTPFGSFGFYAGGTEVEADVRFDNAAARELSGEDVSSAFGRAVTSSPADALPITDDFSEAGLLPTGEDPGAARFSYEDGDYVMSFQSDRPQWIFPAPLADPVDAIEARTRASATAGSIGFGVACYASPSAGYIFAVSPESEWLIARETEKGLELLAGGQLRGRIGSRTVLVGGTCEPGAPGTTALTLSLDGQRIKTVRDRSDFGPFSLSGLFASSQSGTGSARFEDLVLHAP